MQCQFFFDFLSPYSFIAFDRISRLRSDALHNVTVIFKPTPMIPLIKGHDTKGPAEIPMKRDILFKDILRKVHRRHLEFRLPKRFPFLSQLALRFGCFPEKSHQINLALMTAAWVEEVDMEDEDALVQFIVDRVEVSKDELKAWGSSREARKALKTNLKEAQSLGLFGVPSFVCDMGGQGEIFWGDEMIDEMTRFFSGTDYYSQEIFQDYTSRFESS